VEALIEITVRGLAVGSMYGVVALGFVVVYRSTRVLNFAHGALGAAGGVLMGSMVGDGGLGIVRWRGANPLGQYADSVWGWSLNLLLAMCLAAVLAMLIERIAIRPLLGRSQFTVLVATVGVSISLMVYVREAPIPRNLRTPWGSATWRVGDAIVSQSYVPMLVMSGAAFAAVFVFSRSRWGLMMRAMSSDREVAASVGIDLGLVSRLSWAIAGALATVAAVGLSFSPEGTGAVNATNVPGLFFRALPILALGGWDSYRGAMAGGLAIGLLQTATGRLLAGWASVLGAGFPIILPYVVMVIVLAVRPTGLFGERPVERV
jgi:branched-chain amino acid transport system permease protein